MTSARQAAGTGAAGPAVGVNTRHGYDKTGTSDTHSATTPSYRPLPEAIRHPGEPHEHRQHDREQQYHHVHGAHLVALVLTCKRGVPRVSAPAPPAAARPPSNAPCSAARSPPT